MLKPSDVEVGTVYRILGKEVSVHTASKKFDCYLRGRLFTGDGSGERNQLAVGDRVELTPLSASKGVIHAVLPRKTAIVRQVGKRKPKLQVLAANVDQIVIVSALERPRFKVGLIDRFLVIAHDANIAPALCLNKIDLGDEQALIEARAELERYRALGYPVIFTSAKTEAGHDELRALLKDKRSVLTGHSGVGKTKLAAAIQPGLQLSSAGVDRHGKGRHTTTASTLFSLDFGGELVDTPGVRELSLGHIERRKLAEGFIELRAMLHQCHFASCSHIHEPHCVVKGAVEDGRIARERYDSYCRLYEELG